MSTGPYSRHEPHQLVIIIDLAAPGEKPPRQSGISVMLRAWAWSGGTTRRRIPDNRLTYHDLINGVSAPHDRASIAKVLRRAAARFDRPA